MDPGGINIPQHGMIEPTKCEILGTFGVFVQVWLGLLSFAALLIKRVIENPKRPVVVWLLDTSKQAFSSVLAHCINLILAVLLSKAGTSDNWDWYFINITVDVLLGVFLCFFILKGIEKVAIRYQINVLNTGNYVNIDYEKEFLIDFEPTKQTEIDDIDYRIWWVQIVIWGMIVIVVKITLFFFQLLFASVLEIASSVFIGWLRIYPNVKLVLIMVIVPFLLNTFQFWIQDNILKAKKETTIEFYKHDMERKRKTMISKPKIEMVAHSNSKRFKSYVGSNKHLNLDNV